METHQVAWQGVCIEESLPGLLEDALAENRVAEALAGLPPRHSFYLNLKKTLASYRELARKTKWKPFPEGLALRRGDKGKEVREQRTSSRAFDEALEAALHRF